MEITEEILNSLTNRLKVGNRRGVHLNALPGRSRYKFDLSRLSIFQKEMPNDFINNLLDEKTFKFKISPQTKRVDEEKEKEINKTARSLQNLINHSDSLESEKGINSFGFGFPTIIFKSKTDNRLVFAPLLIWSLKIKNLGEANSFQVIKKEDDPVYINEVLINYLESDSNIKLDNLTSEILEDGLVDREELIQICNETLLKLNSENSLNKETGFNEIEKYRDKLYYKDKLSQNVPMILNSGLFSIYEVQKQNLINDYKFLQNQESLIEIKNFIGSPFQSISSVQTDPSQQSILNSISTTRNIIIQGPPGTGKSQSLTAILLNALENNKKTLVVCEKKTALEILENNLTEFGFDQNCMLIKDTVRDRRKVIDSVRNRVDNINYKNHYYPFSKADYEIKLNTINDLISKVNKGHIALDKELLEDSKWSDLVGMLLQIKDNSGIEEIDIKAIFNNLSEINLLDYNNSLPVLESKYKKVKKEDSRPSISITKLLNGDSFKIEKEVISQIKEYGDLLVGEKSWFDQLEIKNQQEPDFFDISNSENRFYRFTALFSSRRKSIIQDQRKFIEVLNKFLKKIDDEGVYQEEQINKLIDKKDPFKTLKNLREFNDKIVSIYLENKNKILDEIDWFKSISSLKDQDQKLIQLLQNQENWLRVFQFNVYEKILDHFVSSDLPIDEESQNKISVLLEEIKTIQIKYINDLWLSNLIDSSRNFYNNNGITVENLYNKRSSKKFKRNSLRQIVKADINLFTDFFPIVLTTPDAASNLFGMQKESFFDIVLFDEASQLRIEDTLPSLLKGKQIIVAGDEHQMPPSNYFSKAYEGSDESDLEEDDEFKFNTDDFLLASESLLEFSGEFGFEKSFLDFHYRSRHPDLIQFSNYAFYEGRLKPMMNIEEYKPISFKQVDGVYFENTNKMEANEVISILENKIKRLPNGKYPSIGIATFNISQRDLIIDEILKKRRGDSSKGFNDKMIEFEQEGFFVKNLENIQGDERDVIILSTTYGVNSEGKFHKRFGQVNQQKGYKLLNVIITRAKHKLYVCSSIPENQFLNYSDLLDKEGSNNRYPVFYAYLAYCKAISEDDNELKHAVLNRLSINGDHPTEYSLSNLKSPIIEVIANILRTNFPEANIHTNHKISEFYIDILIEIKGKVLNKIIIEIDGSKEHSSGEAYLNDIYREQVLTSFGFKLHRIWSTNFWRNSIHETNKLVSSIKNSESEFQKRQIEKVSQTFID